MLSAQGSAGVEDEALGGGVARGGGLVDLDDAGDFVERLDGDVVELRVLTGAEVVERDGEAGFQVVHRAEDVDHADLGGFAGDDERVREDDRV